jgi:hypothetical protein
MQKMLYAVMMFDEISVEAHPHWDDKTNNILGVCHEHGHHTSLEFTSEEDLHTLWEELQCGKIHLACEVYVDVCHSGALNDNNLICHAPLIGNSQCDRDFKSTATTLQCMSHPYIWKLQVQDGKQSYHVTPGCRQCYR